MRQYNCDWPQFWTAEQSQIDLDSNIRNIFQTFHLCENLIFSSHLLTCIFRLDYCDCSDCSQYMKRVTMFLRYLVRQDPVPLHQAINKQNGMGEGNTAVKNLNIRNSKFQYFVIHSVLTGMDLVTGYSTCTINYQLTAPMHPIP